MREPGETLASALHRVNLRLDDPPRAVAPQAPSPTRSGVAAPTWWDANAAAENTALWAARV